MTIKFDLRNIRWNSRRKAAVALCVARGSLGWQTAIEAYGLSYEELRGWVEALEYGLKPQATRLTRLLNRKTEKKRYPRPAPMRSIPALVALSIVAEMNETPVTTG